MNKKHVHIIEDSELTIYTIKSEIEKEFILSSSKNFNEFMINFKSGFIPDLYIIDLNFSDMDGLEILKTLSEVHIPKIVYSSRTDIDTIEKCFSLGAYDFLKKPTPAREIKIRIYKTLQYFETISSKEHLDFDEIKGAVAHYFGQPLTALGTEIYLLKNELGKTASTKAYTSLLRLEKAYSILVNYYNTFKNIDTVKKISYLNSKNILDLENND
jgi:DNA-binding NtrC family response regulator